MHYKDAGLKTLLIRREVSPEPPIIDIRPAFAERLQAKLRSKLDVVGKALYGSYVKKPFEEYSKDIKFVVETIKEADPDLFHELHITTKPITKTELKRTLKHVGYLPTIVWPIRALTLGGAGDEEEPYSTLLHMLQFTSPDPAGWIKGFGRLSRIRDSKFPLFANIESFRGHRLWRDEYKRGLNLFVRGLMKRIKKAKTSKERKEIISNGARLLNLIARSVYIEWPMHYLRSVPGRFISQVDAIVGLAELPLFAAGKSHWENVAKEPATDVDKILSMVDIDEKFKKKLEEEIIKWRKKMIEEENKEKSTSS